MQRGSKRTINNTRQGQIETGKKDEVENLKANFLKVYSSVLVCDAPVFTVFVARASYIYSKVGILYSLLHQK